MDDEEGESWIEEKSDTIYNLAQSAVVLSHAGDFQTVIVELVPIAREGPLVRLHGWLPLTSGRKSG